MAKYPRHYNKIQRNDAWQRIAEEIKRPVNDCNHKMTAATGALSFNSNVKILFKKKITVY